MPAPPRTHALMAGMLSLSTIPAKSVTARSDLDDPREVRDGEVASSQVLLENLARAGPRFAQDEALAEEVAHGRRRMSGLVCPRPPVNGAPLRLLRRCHGDIALARKRLEVESLTIKKAFYQGEVDRSLVERAHQASSARGRRSKARRFASFGDATAI